MKCLIIVLCLWVVVEADLCSRKPAQSVTRYQKLAGDNGFKIIINGDPDRYVPGEFYAITLVGARTHNQLQKFTRFSIGAEPRDPNAQSTPQTHGQFQLFADTISTFDENCVNVVKEADDLPKTEVQVVWKAPRAGSGCVLIKAMVFENPRKWFAEDGQLTRQICEQTKKASTVSNNECCACDEAKYNMVFEGLWSNVTHPKDFPSSLWLTHFSDVIGASHEKNFTFWGEGQIATDGFRSLAEWGSVRSLELELIVQQKYLKTIVKAAGLWYPKVNTNTTASFKVDRQRPMVSLASMLGPTPDWVVGVSGLDLCLKDCSWVENLTIDLYPWDAGTDSGITYMSPNSETKPREKMYRITTKYPEDPRAPFYDPNKDEMNPLARLYLFRDSIIPRNCDEKLLQELILETEENSDDATKPECAVSEYGPWSPCSVTCGKGLRMRSREYVMPMQKVKMFGCNRQLVSKEMCVARIPECEEGSDNNDNREFETSPSDSEICATSEYSAWSDCSVTCGVGFKMRTRHFLNHMGRNKCPQVDTVQKDKCMMPECRPEDIEVEDPDCPVTPWSDWSVCSTSCGQGIRMRMRTLLAKEEMKEECSQRVQLTEQATCSLRPSCQLDMATAKKICMEPIDSGYCRSSYDRWGFNTEKAMCVPFVYNGCKGTNNNFLTEQDCMNTCGVVRDAIIGTNSNFEPESQVGNRPTFQQQVPQQRPQQERQVTPPLGLDGPLRPLGFSLRQDCVLTEWSDWSQCSATCGRGFTTSHRSIRIRAENGGRECSRKLFKRKGCFLGNC